MKPVDPANWSLVLILWVITTFAAAVSAMKTRGIGDHWTKLVIDIGFAGLFGLAVGISVGWWLEHEYPAVASGVFGGLLCRELVAPATAAFQNRIRQAGGLPMPPKVDADGNAKGHE